MAVALPVMSAAASNHTSVVSLTDADTRILAINSLEDMSDDGRFVLFASDSDSISDARPGPFESYLYVRDRQAATTTLVAPAKLGQGAAISNTGSVVAFSTETSLVPADTNGLADVYAVRNAGSPELVSSRGGVVHTTGSAEWVVMSGDESTAAFQAYASDDLVEGDTPGFFRRNAIVADLTNGDLERLPFPPVPVGTEVEGVMPIELSNDGQLVVAIATVLPLGGSSASVTYLWNRATDAVLVVEPAASPGFFVTARARFSVDGSRVRFLSSGPDTSLDQRFVVTTINTSTGGVIGTSQFEAPETLLPPLNQALPVPSVWTGGISGDGTRVALYQFPLGSTIWVHDVSSGESIALVRDVQYSDGNPPMLSADGSILAFEQRASDVTMVVDILTSEVGPSVFSDTGDSIFRDDILWLFDQEITNGCTPSGTEFCPTDPVTRGQMAAFINRALDLPTSSVDQFTDDDTSIFEADIQALAAAGITMGCNPDGTAFCPDDLVTRGQMAAFLDRALDLTASDVDQFTDDDGSIFEANIQALSAAGVTRGCNAEGTLFCPDDFVTRGQMAAFLRRGLGGQTVTG